MAADATALHRSAVSTRRRRGLPERALNASPKAAIVVFVVLLVAIVVSLLVGAAPAMAHAGFGLLSGTLWEPPGHLGTLIFVVGTAETTAITMVVVVPVGLGCALFFVGFVPRRLRSLLSTAIELMAGVPSVVYGLWGLQIGVPFVQHYFGPALSDVLGGAGLASDYQLGVGLMLASLILSMMALPTMVAVSRDVLMAVPAETIEGAVALGATRWQSLTRVAMPVARSGLLGAMTLAMGRAIGESMAISMVIGNNEAGFAHSLFSPAATMTSVLVNHFTSANQPYSESGLVFLGLVLLLFSVAVNVGARLLVGSTRRGTPVRDGIAT